MADEFASNHKKCQRITVSLIVDRNIPNRSSLSADEMAAALLKLSHVRLDREEISTIDDLDCLGPVTNLYLQKNKIEKIQNLDVLPKLRFLTLADNKIINVENLKMLSNLRFLDLSNNMIEHIDPGTLPPGLLILLLKGNPMRNTADYRTKLLQALPSLQQLDDQMITREDRLKAGCTVKSDSESDGGSEKEELENSDSVDDITNGTLRQHCDDIIVRAKLRIQKEEKEHEKRMEELAHFRNLHLQTKCSQSVSLH